MRDFVCRKIPFRHQSSFFKPTVKSIPGSGRRSWCGYGSIIVCGNLRYATATIRVKANRILIDRPLCMKSSVLRYFICRKIPFCRQSSILKPTVECIPGSGRRSWCGNGSIIVCYNRSNGTTTIRVKANCILIDRPLYINCFVTSNGCICKIKLCCVLVIGIPPSKRKTSFCRLCWFYSFVTVVNCL
ncbi:hypothetical protein NEOCIP111885_01452 [Pseudoneobacillus rhizosphaerae]|uniref:Uncharacterized protein n=1 Tax=Pseudoneobacillus rhizosphaerae TaxID=2880968 RepID=A0A9C7G954_9BACI|nr:hypothetical protein NEOCIP111885_01452 [Pseudoneobacillus rhizosphaerae]